MKKLSKGCLVRLNPHYCFTVENGGGRVNPLTNWYADEKGVVDAARPVTSEERAAWYASAVSKGMNSAGETKLPPASTSVELHRDRIYQVLRARCRVQLGWGKATGGLAKILCTQTGEETYIKRDLLEVVS